MDRPRFVIEPSEAESMAKQSDLSLLNLLPTLVKSAQALARAPISNFYVGAVGLGSSGRIYFGANLEFPGLPLHHSVHAEQFLITNLTLNAEPYLKFVAVSDAPCGHCRQFFQEIRHAPDIKILVTGINKDLKNGNLKEFESLSHFLPHRFGPNDLLEKDAPLVLEPHDNQLSLPEIADGISVAVSDRTANNGFSVGVSDKLKLAALEAANRSHAPYSNCPSGVALMDSQGKIFKGSYTESAAYNPSLGPVQAAIVAFMVGGGGGYDGIVGCVLVEKEGVVVRQEHTARLLLQVIAPKCEFKVFHCV
ncbi:cytidine deaminase 1 [Euphorbia peplus]|nr:cytidine deaminase 1 [Euphorbia peplus]